MDKPEEKIPTVHIKAPWGEYKTKTMLEFIRQTRDQLQYFLHQKKTPDPKATKDDIMAYDKIINSGSEKNANEFLKAKHDAMKSGKPFKNNFAVIEYLEKSNLWE